MPTPEPVDLYKRVLRMHEQGLNTSAIGERIGRSRSSANRVLQRALVWRATNRKSNDDQTHAQDRR